MLLEVLNSGRVPSALARATMNFVPIVTEAGIDSVGAARKLAPGAKAGTGTAGVSSTSPAPCVWSSER